MMTVGKFHDFKGLEKIKAIMKIILINIHHINIFYIVWNNYPSR